MKDNKQSITYKVVIGYLLIAALAAIAVWFVYSQVKEYTSMAETNLASNNKLYLVGDAATTLYEAESLSRQLISTGDSADFRLYQNKIDSIRVTLDALRQSYADTILNKEILSINFLLSQKTANLEELLDLRAQEDDQSYYARAITELQRVDQSFEKPDYEERFANLEPHQRQWLVRLLEFSNEEDTQQVSTQTIDSLVNNVRMVLVDLERADRRFRESLRSKENELLVNEININSQLRTLFSSIEEEERLISLEQVATSQNIVRSTSRTIAILGAISFLVILIFLFLVVKDVSRSQQYRNKLQEAKLYAESLLKSREQFMNTITHDLRSPLNTVLGYSSLLEKSNLTSSQRNYLRHMKNSSDYILQLVNDLLDFSKLEAGKIRIEILSFDAKNLIEATVENSIPLEKREKLEVQIEFSKQLNFPIKSDPFRIKQILTNLVTNACKFTEEGYIRVSADLESNKTKKELLIIVEDTGMGISEEKKEAIFEEFSQESSNIEKKFGGFGLGLAITKKLINLLNGSIELESEQGKGSRFSLRIPVEVGEHFSPERELIPEPAEEDRKELSVLIVDDEPAQIGLLQELVKGTGMKPNSCNNGKEALRILQTKDFHLVLTDIQMPIMDGFQLLKEIKNNPKTKDIPVIALSGKTDTLASDYRKKGFSGSLMKPYSPRQLLEIIEQVLNIHVPKTEKSVTTSSDPGSSYSLEEIRLFAGDDNAAMKTILRVFIDSSMANLETLKEAHTQEDWKTMAATAHKMLPMFRQVKATAIVPRLADMETRNNNYITGEELEDLSADIAELMEHLQGEIID